MSTCDIGCIHVYTGPGFGKTTAALGYSLRMLGEGKRVAVIYFNRAKLSMSEQKVLDQMEGMGLEYSAGNINISSDFDKSMLKPQHIKEGRRLIMKAKEIANSGKYDLIILDEINAMTAIGIVPVDYLLDFLKSKPAHMEVILTGDTCDEEVLRIANFVTRMQ